jgi:cyclopropane-fatty-acyl-phospholipid synthase
MIYDVLFEQLKRNNIPDVLLVQGIRYLTSQKLREYTSLSIEQRKRQQMEFIADLKSLPIAVESDAANSQHYMVTPEFYEYVLGKYKKYSCCYYQTGTESLDTAEHAMLEIYCERAQLKDGQKILDLGCGWGSLSLFLAQKYPNADITGISNSTKQRLWIEEHCKQRNIVNLTIKTANIITHQEEPDTYDRILSIEMFEHMKNYQLLFQKVSLWMKLDAKLFIHIFAHQNYAYHYEVKDETDWMTKYFFTGGTMPSDDLFLYFQDDVKIENHWNVSGTHYGKTSDHWYQNLLEHKKAIIELFEKEHSPEVALQNYTFWKVFFLSCREFFAYDNGNQWGVSHYLFSKKAC